MGYEARTTSVATGGGIMFATGNIIKCRLPLGEEFLELLSDGQLPNKNYASGVYMSSYQLQFIVLGH